MDQRGDLKLGVRCENEEVGFLELNVCDGVEEGWAPVATLGV